MRREWILPAAFAGLGGGVALVLLRRGEVRGAGPAPESYAHRGDSAELPENTLAAFQSAIEAGVEALEMDVHLSADGAVVVIHDAEVDRTTNGTGPVSSMTLAELKKLDAGYRFTPDGGATCPHRGRGMRIPTLEEVYQEFPGVRFNFEIKEDQTGINERVLRVIREAGAENRTLVAAFSHNLLKRFRELSGGTIETAASGWETRLFYALSLLRLESLSVPSYEAFQVPPSYQGITVVTPRFVRAAHARGVRVDVWAIDDPEEMRRLLDLGVDGVMTNRPVVLEEVLRERRRASGSSGG